jgi:hypothetical protein
MRLTSVLVFCALLPSFCLGIAIDGFGADVGGGVGGEGALRTDKGRRGSSSGPLQDILTGLPSPDRAFRRPRFCQAYAKLCKKSAGDLEEIQIYSRA